MKLISRSVILALIISAVVGLLVTGVTFYTAETFLLNLLGGCEYRGFPFSYYSECGGLVLRQAFSLISFAEDFALWFGVVLVALLSLLAGLALKVRGSGAVQ